MSQFIDSTIFITIAFAGILPIAPLIFGVSAMTLRRWDKKGVLKPFRPHPSNVRRYRKQDIIRFINKK